MEYINISHSRIHPGKIITVSSEAGQQDSAHDLLQEGGFWSSEKRNAPVTEYVVIDYDEVVWTDYILVKPSLRGKQTFPRSFRIEGSDDGKVWMIITSETKFDFGGDEYRIDIPLTRMRYLKFVVVEPSKHNNKFYVELGKIEAGIGGIKELTASSSASDEEGAANLLSDDTKSHWTTKPQANSTVEHLLIDLGKVMPLNRLVLGSTGSGFPENFHVNEIGRASCRERV